MFLDFLCGSAGKESACNAGDLGLIPRLGRSPGERKGYPPQYSGLENSMEYIVHGVAKSRTDPLRRLGKKNMGGFGSSRDQIASIHWITEKAREFQKNIYFCLLTMPKPMTLWIRTNCGKFLKRWEYHTTLLAF